MTEEIVEQVDRDAAALDHLWDGLATMSNPQHPAWAALTYVKEQLAHRRAALQDDDETYKIGVRDGYEEAVRDIDLATGGDGEFRYCIGYREPGRHCPDAETMKARIIARFEDRAALQEADGLERALIDTAASLAAALSILQRANKDKVQPRLAVASNTMFATMMIDYQKSLDRAREALSSYRKSKDRQP